MQTDPLDPFVSKLLAEKNLPPMPDDVRAELHADMRQRLADVINRDLIAALPDAKVEGFEALVDDESKTSDDMQTYIADSGVDVERVMLDTMLRFGAAYLGRPLDV